MGLGKSIVLGMDKFLARLVKILLLTRQRWCRL